MCWAHEGLQTLPTLITVISWGTNLCCKRACKEFALLSTKSSYNVSRPCILQKVVMLLTFFILQAVTIIPTQTLMLFTARRWTHSLKEHIILSLVTPAVLPLLKSLCDVFLIKLSYRSQVHPIPCTCYNQGITPLWDKRTYCLGHSTTPFPSASHLLE